MEIYSVSALTEGLRRDLERIYPFVWVKGEVGSVSRPSSGHVYFVLKDADAVLNCVWFRGQQRPAETFDPLTGEVFEDGPRESLALRLENGQQLLCAGRITVYGVRGQYQLMVDLAQEEGLGKLHAAFESLKHTLKERGFFAQDRKRVLPRSPQRVALVTAPHGAVIHDFIRIASSRGCGAQLRLYPVPVQGSGAALAIAAAINAVNAAAWAEIIVLMRGGGSLEDLWAFNEMPVAEAIFASQIPVLAAIGHEVDHSIADMTADLRAPTPSHAAALLWPERADLAQRVDAIETALRAAGARWLAQRENMLARAQHSLEMRSPLQTLRRAEDFLSRESERLHRITARWFADIRTQCARYARTLHAHSPQRLLAHWQKTLQRESVRLHIGVHRSIQAAEVRLDTEAQRLANVMERRMLHLSTAQEAYALRLEAASPLTPLKRGYALVRDTSGALITRARQTAAGSTVRVLLLEGEIEAHVTKTHEESNLCST